MNLDLGLDIEKAGDSTAPINGNIEVKVSQEKLSHALSLVTRAVAKHPLQPVLNNVLLQTDAEKNVLMVAGTNLDLSLAVEITVDIVSNGKITVPAQKLLEIVSKLPKTELTLSSDDKYVFQICSGRSKFEVKSMSADEFPVHNFSPEINSDEEIETITLPISHLKKSSELVSFASDRKEVNTILNGICMELGDKGLEIAATDGSRLAYYHVPDMSFTKYNKSIIPHNTVEELRRMIADLDDSESITCYLGSSSSIAFKTESRFLSSNLIEGSYPKYQQLIPEGYIQCAKVNRQSLIQSLERVAVLANEKSRVIKLLFEENGVLTILANTPDLGDARDQLDLIEYEGQTFNIAFNVNYMIECLKTLSCDEIELHMSESLKPIIINPLFDDAGDEDKKEFNYLYLLMPIQLRNN